MSASATKRRWPLVAVAAIGVGLALAPVAFQMFERAPKGGDMIDGFGPYMDQAEIDEFRAHLSTIGAAQAELGPVLTDDARPQLAAVASFDAQWSAIDADMRSMLDDMEANIGAYEGVAALPPFALFPWFFVLPGLLLAAGAVWALRSGSAGRNRGIVAVGVVAVGLLLAPVAFQMFSRAPAGADMIDDFRPFMRPEKVTQIQGYFLTIGAAEGQLRQIVLPEVAANGGPALPAVDTLVGGWQRLSADMAPMIGAMADNVDNFAAVAALPPFGSFPWFFVAPGLLVLALAVVARRRPVEYEPAAAPPPILEGAST